MSVHNGLSDSLSKAGWLLLASPEWETRMRNEFTIPQWHYWEWWVGWEIMVVGSVKSLLFHVISVAQCKPLLKYKFSCFWHRLFKQLLCFSLKLPAFVGGYSKDFHKRSARFHHMSLSVGYPTGLPTFFGWPVSHSNPTWGSQWKVVTSLSREVTHWAATITWDCIQTGTYK